MKIYIIDIYLKIYVMPIGLTDIRYSHLPFEEKEALFEERQTRAVPSR